MNLKKFQSFRSGRFVYFAGGPESGLSEGGRDKEPTAGKEIFAEVSRMKRQLESKETSGKLVDTVEGDSEDENAGTNLLKDDTTVLISENSEKSRSDREERHNKAGWKGLVWKDDMVRILDKYVTKIDGREYVNVRVRHNLNKFKDPGNPKYRIYEGYVEVSAFKGGGKEVAEDAKEKQTESPVVNPDTSRPYQEASPPPHVTKDEFSEQL